MANRARPWAWGSLRLACSEPHSCDARCLGKKKGCIFAHEQAAGVCPRAFHSNLLCTQHNRRTADGSSCVGISNEPRWLACGPSYTLTVRVLGCARSWAARHAENKKVNVLRPPRIHVSSGCVGASAASRKPCRGPGGLCFSLPTDHSRPKTVLAADARQATGRL